nr:MAG TPA: hypothetical protein [Caudoviricetes sp.]
MNYKSVIIFGAGVAIGILGTKRYFEKQSEESISAMEEVLNKQKAKENKDGDEAELSDNGVTDFSNEKALNIENNSIDVSDLKKQSDIIRYNQYSSKEPKKKSIDELAERESPTEEYPNEPYMIDRDDYEDLDEYYDKVEVSIYDDGAIVNENTNELLDEDCLGMNNLRIFLETDPSATVMYLRNEKLMTDYEVVKVNGRYSEIEGLEEGGDDE